jgi:hypothetical protein
MFVKDEDAADPNRALKKIFRVFRSLSLNNFEHLQTSEAAHIKKNYSIMSENMMMQTEFLNLSPKVKVCLSTCTIFISSNNIILECCY